MRYQVDMQMLNLTENLFLFTLVTRLHVHITVLIQIADCKHHTMKNLLLLLRELWVDTQAFSILVIIFHLICNHYYHDDDD